MARLKCTEWPWFVGDLDKHGQRIVRNHHIEICTCWHHSVGSIEKEMEVNARLIAAAPELYAALEAAQEELRLLRMKDTSAVYNPTLRTQITIALAQARGKL